MTRGSYLTVRVLKPWPDSSSPGIFFLSILSITEKSLKASSRSKICSVPYST